MMTRPPRTFILTLLICLTTPLLPGAAAEIPQEFKVKAGYLLNLPLFSDWAPVHHSGCATFTICIMGDTPLDGILNATKDRRIKNRPVAVRTIKELGQADCCQVLFIAASERYRLQRLLPEAHRRGIMTVSDMRDFTRAGGMVTLVTVNSRIGFDLNLLAAKNASITFSSQLLKLANDVTR